MKSNYLKAFTGLLFVGSTALAVTTELNFTKINESLSKASSAFDSEAAKVNQFSVSIVEKGTNPDNDQYEIASSGTFRSPWQKADVSFSKDVNLAVKLSGKDTKEQVSGSQTFEIHLDTIAMINHYGKKMVEKCEGLVKKGRRAIFQQEGCKLATEWSKATSLESIHTSIQTYKTQIVARLNTLKDEGTAKQESKDLSGILLEDLTSYNEKTGKMITKTGQLQSTFEKGVLTISIPRIKCKDFNVQDLKLQASDSEIKGSAKIEIASPYGTYALSKPEILAMLKDLESGNETAIRHVKAKLVTMWGVFAQKAGIN